MSNGHRILIGTSGFSYPDWHGTFYPQDFKKRKIHELEFLSEFFDFCEINNRFYRPVNPEVAQKWCQYVANNKEFQFTAKLTEVFTHAPGRGNKKSSSMNKIVNQTRHSQTSGDADWEVSGFVSDYSVSTAGVSQQQASINRLNVSVHITLLDRKKNNDQREFDVSHSFDFSASQTLQQAESQQGDDIVRNMTDEIFNQIFSNW